MHKNKLILIATLAIAAFSSVAYTAFKDSQKEATPAQAEQLASAAESEQEHSVAWYTANIRAAKAKNRECYENNQLQGSTNCRNALHALEISFVGGN